MFWNLTSAVKLRIKKYDFIKFVELGARKNFVLVRDLHNCPGILLHLVDGAALRSDNRTRGVRVDKDFEEILTIRRRFANVFVDLRSHGFVRDFGAPGLVKIFVLVVLDHFVKFLHHVAELGRLAVKNNSLLSHRLAQPICMIAYCDLDVFA